MEINANTMLVGDCASVDAYKPSNKEQALELGEIKYGKKVETTLTVLFRDGLKRVGEERNKDDLVKILNDMGMPSTDADVNSILSYGTTPPAQPQGGGRRRKTSRKGMKRSKRSKRSRRR